MPENEGEGLENPELDQEGTQTEPEPDELSTEEQTAFDKGWRPEADYTGDGEWIGAKEFNGRQPLYDGLSKQSKRLKHVEGVVQTLADQLERANEVALKQARAEIREERIEALDAGDNKRALELEDKEKEMSKPATLSPEAIQAHNEEFNEWRADNDWYGTDEDATIYANAYAEKLRAQLTEDGDDMTTLAFYDKVTAKVKTAMPTSFGKRLPDRGNVPDGQGGQRRVSNKKREATYRDLNEEQRKVCRTLVDMGAMGENTQAKYIKQLDEMGEIDKG